MVELVGLVTGIASGAMVAAPRFGQATQNAKCAATAGCFDAFQKGITMYYCDYRGYPADTSGNAFPDAFDGYINVKEWKRPVPIGGVWDWNTPPSGGWAGKPHNVSITLSPAANSTWQTFDTLFDDGSLADGKYLVFPGRLTNYCRPIE